MMAKICTAYGTSPNTSSPFNDWNELDLNTFSNDIGIIKNDFTDLFGDLHGIPSLHSDIQKIEADGIGCGIDTLDNIYIDSKPEIRTDLMWSGTSSSTGGSDILGTSPTSSIGGDGVTAVPLAVVTGSVQNISNNLKQQQQQVRAPTVVVAGSNRQSKAMTAAIDIKTEIKMEPSDDYEQQLQQHSIPNSRTAQATTTTGQKQRQQTQQPQSMQHIPPGTSLLRKSNTQQQQQQQKKLQQQQQKIQIPKMQTAEFLRERDQLLNSGAAATKTTTTTKPATKLTLKTNGAMYVRPDTPHSLDDDATPEFKHNVDLRACVMGSNNIALTADPTNYINHVCQELQDTSKSQIDVRFSIADYQLTDVLDLIGTCTPDASLASSSSTTSSSNCFAYSKSKATTAATMLRNSDCDSDEESCYGSNSDLELPYEITSPVPSQDSAIGDAGNNAISSSSSSSSVHLMHHQPQTYMHSDHSYTRCKDGIDDLGTNLETPSDSDEEIDVVSIGDKKLPTNPSDKDRRVIQSKVAHKFSSARIVKNANGLRTIPPRRRISYEPYTPASSSPVKSVAHSRYPSPTSTPYQNQYTSKYVEQQQEYMLLKIQADGSSSAVLSDKARKRVVVNGSVLEYALPPSKKHRGKKPKTHASSGSIVNPNSAAAAAAAIAASKQQQQQQQQLQQSQDEFNYLDETADTIEKRNLHNDMERQRRIGLKNLFEALKKQIPSIKDKERAPKVNILREAAKLCESLTREDRQLSEQKAQLKEQLRKNQEKLARLRALHGRQNDD